MSNVIIDDIDVSGCVRLAIDNISCDLGGECKGWDNCYYKQLQRLKHQYADVLKLAKENADSNEYCLQELEQENERLKEDFKDTTDGLLKIQYTLADSCKKYEQALEDIRDIVFQSCDYCKYGKDGIHCRAGDCGDGKLQIIQAKINSVIGAEE